MKAVVVWLLCGVVWALFLARVVVPAARNPNTNGFVAIYTEARVLLEAPRDLPRVYDDAWFQSRIDQLFEVHVRDIIRAQPPTMGLIMLPLAWLPPAPARAVWTALGVLFWVCGLAALASGLRMSARAQSMLVVSAASTIYTPLADNLRQGQSYLLLFFFLCLALRSLLLAPLTHPHRATAAGVALGLMAVLKAAGAWLWPLLAVARQGRALLAAAVVMVAVAGLALPLTGWDAWSLYVHDFGWLAADPGARVTAHQTVLGFFGHLLVLEPHNPFPVADLPRLAATLTALVTAGAFVVTARLQRLDGELEERALTLGLFVALMVPMAPRAEGYHYVLVFPALVIAAWWALRAPAGRGARWALLGCAALLCVPRSLYQSPEIARGWLALLAYPRLAGAFGLWAWLAWALRCVPSAR